MYNRDLLDDLPDSVDPGGENGEFHTFVFNGSMFDHGIDVSVGNTIKRDGFVFTDIVSSQAHSSV